ncbi:MAG: M13 family peptidase, partial [Flavobacterium sp.]
MKKTCLLFTASLCFAFVSLGFSQTTDQSKPGINLNYMDRSVKPGDDFFRFVNGTWYDQTEIPSDRTRWGSFDELRQKTDDDMKIILKEALNNPAYTASSDQGKALNLYRSVMDTITRDKQGIKPLQPYLEKINKVKTVADLQKLFIEMEAEG